MWELDAPNLPKYVFDLFNSLSTSKCFILFWVIFLLRLNNLVSKSVFVIKLACASLALKTSPANLLNSEVAIYLSWLWSLSLFIYFFLTKSLTLSILFSTVVNAAGIKFSN